MEAKDIVNLNILTHFVLEGLAKSRFGIYYGRLNLFDKMLAFKFINDKVSITFYDIYSEEPGKELIFKDLNVVSMSGIGDMILEIFNEVKGLSNA